MMTTQNARVGIAPTHFKHPNKYKNRSVNGGGKKLPQRREGYITQIVPKAISRTRADIGTWKKALQAADSVDNPRRARLYNLYSDILLDAHLTALIELRYQFTLSTPFVLQKDGKPDDEITHLLNSKRWVTELNRHILAARFWEHSLVELTTNETEGIVVTLIHRNNIVPEQGLFLRKEDDTTGIKYREAREFGTWILEFWEKNQYGLLNKAIPHVLFKRFAQACWSELCEIYAIPPRYIKTDTTNPEMLDRAEAMLRDMGAAAYFIIDTTEQFEFAKGADTKGEVYDNLITLCKNEMSLLINGAVMGQDTKHGNESKEKSSQELFDKIIQSDKRMLETHWNTTVIPALMHIGIIPDGLTFAFQPEEDLEKLWKMTVDSMPYMDVNPEWIKEKFGIDIAGARSNLNINTDAQLSIDTSGFFD